MLPKKVREQAERAERLHAEMYGNTQGAPVDPAVSDPAEHEPVAPAATATTAVNAAEPAQAPVPAPAVQADPWEEKYRVLQGKYNAEVPRLSALVAELQTQVQELRAAPVPAAPAAPTAADIKGMSLDQVTEQFGEDFVSAVAAVAAREATSSVSKLRDEFRPELERVVKTTAESARDAYLRRLGELVPDYAEIDTDDRFTAFLDEAEGLSGRARRDFFAEADARNDAARIAKFFLAFKATTTPAPAAAAAPAADPAIEAMVQPSTSRAARTPPGKRLWTPGDVRQFYADVRRGRYKPDEARRIESDIFAAQTENRFRHAA